MHEKPVGAGKSSFDLVDTGKLFDELALKKDTFFLDAACGFGAYSIAAAKYIGAAGKIFSFDLWPEGLDALQKEIQAGKIEHIDVRLVDLSKRIPLENQSVDVCLMSVVVHDLISDRTDVGTLREVGRVMKPNGTLAVIEFKKIEGPPGPPIHIRLSPQELAAHLEPYGFRLVKTVDIGQYNYLSVFAVQTPGAAVG